MIATAVPQMSRDLGIKSAVEGEIALSVFILACMFPHLTTTTYIVAE